MDGHRNYHTESSKSEKDKYHMISFICGIWTRAFFRTRSCLLSRCKPACRDAGEGWVPSKGSAWPGAIFPHHPLAVCLQLYFSTRLHTFSSILSQDSPGSAWNPNTPGPCTPRKAVSICIPNTNRVYSGLCLLPLSCRRLSRIKIPVWQLFTCVQVPFPAKVASNFFFF